MDSDIIEMVKLMDKAFRDFEDGMHSPPQMVELSFGYAYRFPEKDIYQAILLKLARVQSLVRATLVLLSNGFVQEQCILQRAVDETNEDILFLVYAVTNDTITKLHEEYLEAFWQEEVDESGTLIDSKQNRPMIKRKKIQAYLASFEGAGNLNDAAKTLYKTFSGYVHGAAPQLMDMYGGIPPHFHTNGLLGTPRMEEHSADVWNCVYRSFLSHILVAKAFGSKSHVDILTQHLKQFESNAGKSY